MRARWILVAVSSAFLVSCASKNGNNMITPAPQCSDGIDNDGDGLIDFPDDPGCNSAEGNDEGHLPWPQCSDGRDNDGDGKIDYPDDPGCFDAMTDDETDDCPDGPNCPQCANGKDDDGNGLIDYPADPGCTAASDPTEFTLDADACGSITVKMLPAGGSDSGTLDTTSSTSTVTSTCGGGGGAAAVAYEISLPTPKVIVATTDTGGTTADTVIDIRTRACSTGSDDIACNDNTPGGATDADGNPDVASTVTASLAAGQYYIIVEGHDSSAIGTYQLQVNFFNGEGTPCTDMSQCGPGLVCRVPLGQTMMVCSKPECSDGVDDDGDGKADFPDDPGCTDPSDNDETDDCPSGPNCPACSNGKDDDGDGLTDYPADPSCKSAAGTSESCQSVDPILVLTTSPTDGDTTGAADDFSLSCAFEPTGAPDQVYQLDLPALTSLTINVEDPNFTFFPAYALFDSTCGPSELACGDFDPLDFSSTGVPAGRYFLVVDGDDSTEVGTFEITLAGTIAGGGPCNDTFGGAFTCASGFVCKGASGSKTCQPTQCNDGKDNNSDGKIDFPFDPGCASIDDDTETTVCPGANCPVCSDGKDNDTDGKKDFPADFGCAAAGGTSEVFCAADPDFGGVIAAKTTTSTFASTTADLTLDCGFATDGDLTFALQIPVGLTSLTIDTEGSMNLDTVVELWDPQCTAPGKACNDDVDPGNDDDSKITLGTITAGNYAVSVQTYDASTPGFVLNVAGVAVSGAACTDPLFTAGVLTCATGETCTAGKCK